MGKSQQRELKSRLEVLLTHLLKWEYQPERRQRGHSWAGTILEQRHALADLLDDNPSLKEEVKTVLPLVYARAWERALYEMRPPGGARLLGSFPNRGFDFPQGDPHAKLMPFASVRSRCPWTEHDIFADEFWPGP